VSYIPSYSTASSRSHEVSWSETAERFGLRLDVYSPSQVLQTNGCFYHSPLPPWVSENCKQQGPFAPRTLLRFFATMSPSATLSSSTDFLGSPVIRFAAPSISRRDEEGFSSCLAHPCHRAAANTPPECPTASVSCGGPCCLRPFAAGSAPGAFGFSRPPMRSLLLRPDDSLTIPKMALSIGFIRFVSSANAILATGSWLLPW
jgi:hypothetical protein